MVAVASGATALAGADATIGDTTESVADDSGADDSGADDSRAADAVGAGPHCTARSGHTHPGHAVSPERAVPVDDAPAASGSVEHPAVRPVVHRASVDDALPGQRNHGNSDAAPLGGAVFGPSRGHDSAGPRRRDAGNAVRASWRQHALP